MPFICTSGDRLVAVHNDHILSVNIVSGTIEHRDDVGSGVTAAAFSDNGLWFGVSTADKKVIVWKLSLKYDDKSSIVICDTRVVRLGTDDPVSWLRHSVNCCSKRPTSIAIDATGCVVVADKAGDCYRFSGTTEGELILGHVSMLLAVALSPDGNTVVTCDRDDKIRLSAYPRGWNVMGYCLGHMEFVSTVALSKALPGLLISGSGDGSVRLWDFETCSLLFTLATGEVISADECVLSTLKACGNPIVRSVQVCPITGTIAVTIEGCKTVVLLRVGSDNRTLHVEGSVSTRSEVSAANFDGRGQLWIWCHYSGGSNVLQVYTADRASSPKKYTTTGVTTAVENTIMSEPWSKLVDPMEFRLADLCKTDADGGINAYFEKKGKRELATAAKRAATVDDGQPAILKKSRDTDSH